MSATRYRWTIDIGINGTHQLDHHGTRRQARTVIVSGPVDPGGAIAKLIQACLTRDEWRTIRYVRIVNKEAIK